MTLVNRFVLSMVTLLIVLALAACGQGNSVSDEADGGFSIPAEVFCQGCHDWSGQGMNGITLGSSTSGNIQYKSIQSDN